MCDLALGIFGRLAGRALFHAVFKAFRRNGPWDMGDHPGLISGIDLVDTDSNRTDRRAPGC